MPQTPDPAPPQPASHPSPQRPSTVCGTSFEFVCLRWLCERVKDGHRLKIHPTWESLNPVLLLCVCRDNAEDPLDDTGTVQQQLDQVTWLFSGKLQGKCGRRGCLMVSVLDYGLSGLGSSSGQGHCVVFLGKILTVTLTVPLSTQEYKWLPVNCYDNLIKCWG